MALTELEGPVHVKGMLTAASVVLPAGTVTDAMVNASAAIDADKLQHRHHVTWSNESATAAADGAWVVHVVRGTTASVVSFEAGCVVACVGAATVDVDLLKNGASILTAAISIDSGDAAYAKVVGTIASAALVDGDVLEISVDETAGGGTVGKGVFASLALDEDPA